MNGAATFPYTWAKALAMLRIPTSLPKASSNMLSPQGGAGGDPTLPCGPWPGGSKTLHS